MFHSVERSEMYDGSKTTGFMSPAGDHVDTPIDLQRVLNLSAPSRYLVRVKGCSFAGKGIFDGDILIVDTSRKPHPGAIVVAFVGEEVLLAVAEFRRNHLVLRRPNGQIEDGTSEVWAIAVGLVRDAL